MHLVCLVCCRVCNKNSTNEGDGPRNDEVVHVTIHACTFPSFFSIETQRSASVVSHGLRQLQPDTASFFPSLALTRSSSSVVSSFDPFGSPRAYFLYPNYFATFRVVGFQPCWPTHIRRLNNAPALPYAALPPIPHLSIRPHTALLPIQHCRPRAYGL